MLNLAEKKQNQGLWLDTGYIVEVLEGGYSLQTEMSVFKAERADGCLLDPEAGDLVLLVFSGPDQAFILNVLKRKNRDEPVRYSLGREATLKADGLINLLTPRVNLDAAEDLTVNIGTANFSCEQAHTSFKSLDYEGEEVTGRVTALKTVVKRLEVTADRVMERVKRHYRRVEDFEDSRLGRLHLWINDLFAVDSKSTDIKSTDQVKIDAGKIRLG